MKKKYKAKKHKQIDDFEQDSDETFYYIAGYTPGGAPYGTTWEEIVSDELNIRLAVKKDAKEASELIHLAIGHIAEQLTGQTNIENIRKTLSNFFREEKNRLSYQNTIVADIYGKPVGIIISYPGEKGPDLDEPLLNRLRKKRRNQDISFDKEADDGDYYIDTLCVSPQFQGCGIGTFLIKKTESFAMLEGYNRISINVAHDNPFAKKLYKKLGYHEEKTIQINGHSYEYMVKTVKCVGGSTK